MSHTDSNILGEPLLFNSLSNLHYCAFLHSMGHAFNANLLRHEFGFAYVQDVGSSHTCVLFAGIQTHAGICHPISLCRKAAEDAEVVFETRFR